MAVGADQRVWIHERPAVVLAGPDAAGEVFEVHLVADAGTGRDDTEVVERLLTPAEEAVTLRVALHLEFHVRFERRGRAKPVHHHGVVDHEIHRRKRVDDAGIAARRDDGAAHGREIGHCGNPGEVLHQYPRRPVGDFPCLRCGVRPGTERAHVLCADGTAVLEPKQVLEQHLQ